MKIQRSVTVGILVTIIVLCATTMVFAYRVRGSSENGVDSGAPHWMLVGRMKLLTLKGNNKTATVRREIVCPQQDAENSQPNPVLTLSGSCDSGNYLSIFQVQSTATDLTITFSALTGFNNLDGNSNGVMICDSSQNTIELCTKATQSQIPNITTTPTKTSVSFTVPGTFPTYPGGTAQQGQGLAFFILTQQTNSVTQPNPLPLGAEPTITIK